jgi:hypothetical protein
MAPRRIDQAVYVALACALAIAGCGGKGGKQALTGAMAKIPLDSNLVVNPSFEEWNGAVPTGWQIENMEGSGNHEEEYGKGLEYAKSGRFSFYLRGTFMTDRWMVLVQKVSVIPGYRIAFGGELKPLGLEKMKHQQDRANIFVRFYDMDGKRINARYYAEAYTARLHGTSDWQMHQTVGDVPDKAVTAEIGLINEMNGYLYADDIFLRLSKPIPWVEHKTRYVDFFYLKEHPFPPKAMDEEADYIASCVKKLHVKPKGKIQYYLYPSEEALRAAYGVQRGHERVSFKSHELNTTDPAEHHEVVHMLLENLGYPPFGLAEGSVFYCIGSWEGGRNIHMMAKELLIAKQLPALYMILTQDQMGQIGMTNAVVGWSSFSMYLIDHYGITKFMKLYTKSNGVTDAGTFNSIFKSVYSQDFDVVDRAWRLWVLRYQPKVTQ